MQPQEYVLLGFIAVLILGMGYRIYKRRQDRANLPPTTPTKPIPGKRPPRGQGGRK